MSVALIRKVHATDPPRWWCPGEFDPIPMRHIRGYAVHRCIVCGDELFIDYVDDPRKPTWAEVALASSERDEAGSRGTPDDKPGVVGLSHVPTGHASRPKGRE